VWPAGTFLVPHYQIYHWIESPLGEKSRRRRADEFELVKLLNDVCIKVLRLKGLRERLVEMAEKSTVNVASDRVGVSKSTVCVGVDGAGVTVSPIKQNKS
jgi:hypothetical protein